MCCLLVRACISIHLILRLDSNVYSACQGRWYIMILARARQVEPRRLFQKAKNSCPFYTVSPFFLFFFFICMCTLKIFFIANASRKLTLLSTIQVTCVKVGHWYFKPDYSFNQIHMSAQPANSLVYIKPHCADIFLDTSTSLTEAGCQSWMETFHLSLCCSKLKLR